jgi:hypothetical protein
MRRAEQLIAHVRRATENERAGTADGVSDEEFLEYLNQGQELLQQAIVRAHRTALAKESAAIPASGTEYIDLPSDCFGRQRVFSVFYSSSGERRDAYKLDERRVSERRTCSGSPSTYIPLKDQIIVNPYPAGGSFFVTYDPVMPRIEKRRSLVASATVTAGNLTALTLTTTSPFSQADFDLFDELTLVDSSSAVLAAGIPFTAVSALGVVSIRGGSHTLSSGETVPVGAHVLLGPYSSSVSLMPDLCEKFFLSYCERRILQRDESAARADMSQDEMNQLQEIVATFVEISGDVEDIPVFDNGYFTDDYY